LSESGYSGFRDGQDKNCEVSYRIDRAKGRNGAEISAPYEFPSLMQVSGRARCPTYGYRSRGNVGSLGVSVGFHSCYL
jgi:hypothetical protein